MRGNIVIMEKRKIRRFAFIAGIVAAVGFVAAFLFVRSQPYLPPRLIGGIFAFPSAYLIAAIIALYVAKDWNEDNDDEGEK